MIANSDVALTTYRSKKAACITLSNPSGETIPILQMEKLRHKEIKYLCVIKFLCVILCVIILHILCPRS